MSPTTKDLMDALPERIRVGAFDIEIRPWPSREANAIHRFGQFSGNEALIRIHDDMPSAAHHFDTVIHEITHAIWWAANVQDEDREERTVSALSSGWVQVWRDNPRLVRWQAVVLSRLPLFDPAGTLPPGNCF